MTRVSAGHRHYGYVCVPSNETPFGSSFARA